MYIPKPIDTKNVVLSDQLVALQEKIAENVHEIWAQGRIAEGWTYGEKRDDELKHHPCLVPYSELTDAEKEYDRNTAMETLKLISALGYQIEEPATNKDGQSQENDELSVIDDIEIGGVDINSIQTNYNEIMNSNEEFEYDGKEDIEKDDVEL